MFENLKIVELASVLAGPAAGTFFAELGAQVIKIENSKTGGDMTRRWFNEKESGEGISAYFSSVNYGKTDYLLKDLEDSDDLKEVKKLITDADIVLSNFRESAARRFGLNFEALKQINPTIISAELSGFPDDDRPAFDVVLQAETGFISMTGSDREHLAKMPVALIDVLAAHQLKEGILIALLKQQSQKKAFRIRVNLFETAIASLANIGSNYLMSGKIAEPIGTRHPNIAPYGDIFTAKDGKKLVLSVGTEKQFRELMRLLNIEDYAENKLFSTNAARVKNREDLCDLLQAALGKHHRKDLMKLLLRNRIPAGAIRTVDQVLNTPDAQKLILSEKINGQDTKRVKTAVFKIEE